MTPIDWLEGFEDREDFQELEDILAEIKRQIVLGTDRILISRYAHGAERMGIGTEDLWTERRSQFVNLLVQRGVLLSARVVRGGPYGQDGIEVTARREMVEEVLMAVRGRLNPQPAAQQGAPRERASRRVFVVHGHDDANVLRLERLLNDRFGLEAVVLRDVASMGRTVIEKFEQEAQGCGFAFALLTPDDIVEASAGQYTQARPNVAFELGWFYGKLSRSKVVLLLKQGTRIHSDLDGVVRLEFADQVEERVVEIERELRAAGLIN